MKPDVQRTMRLGDLVASAFEQAAYLSEDPREVSRLATRAVERELRRAQRPAVSRAIIAMADVDVVELTDQRRAKYLPGASSQRARA